MSKKATLLINNQEFDFPIVLGSENETSIDIKNLRSLTGGVTTIDPGFKNTASCESKITYLDGEKGILRYRGYSIEDLSNNASFLEVAYFQRFVMVVSRLFLVHLWFYRQFSIKPFLNSSFNY